MQEEMAEAVKKDDYAIVHKLAHALAESAGAQRRGGTMHREATSVAKRSGRSTCNGQQKKGGLGAVIIDDLDKLDGQRGHHWQEGMSMLRAGPRRT